MSLNLNGNVTGIYLGSTKADAVYLGNVKVLDSGPEISTETIRGKEYQVVKIGNLLVMTTDLQFTPTGATLTNYSEPNDSTTKKCSWYNNSSANSNLGMFYCPNANTAAWAGSASSDGWVLFSYSKLNQVISTLNNGSLPSTAAEADIIRQKIYSVGFGGNNSSGLNISPGRYAKANGYNKQLAYSTDSDSDYWADGVSTMKFLAVGTNNSKVATNVSYSSTSTYQLALRIRLCKTV